MVRLFENKLVFSKELKDFTKEILERYQMNWFSDFITEYEIEFQLDYDSIYEFKRYYQAVLLELAPAIVTGGYLAFFNDDDGSLLRWTFINGKIYETYAQVLWPEPWKTSIVKAGMEAEQ